MSNSFENIIKFKNDTYKDPKLDAQQKRELLSDHILATLKSLHENKEIDHFRNCFYTILTKLGSYMAGEARHVFSKITSTVGKDEDLRKALIDTCEVILAAKKESVDVNTVLSVRDALKQCVVDLTGETGKRKREEPDEGGPSKKASHGMLGGGNKGSAGAFMPAPTPSTAVAPYSGAGASSALDKSGAAAGSLSIGQFNPEQMAQIWEEFRKTEAVKKLEADAQLAKEQSGRALQEVAAVAKTANEATVALQEIRKENTAAQENAQKLRESLDQTDANVGKTTALIDELMAKIKNPPAAPAPAVNKAEVIKEFEGVDMAAATRSKLVKEYLAGRSTEDGFRYNMQQAAKNKTRAVTAANAARRKAPAKAAKASSTAKPAPGSPPPGSPSSAAAAVPPGTPPAAPAAPTTPAPAPAPAITPAPAAPAGGGAATLTLPASPAGSGGAGSTSVADWGLVGDLSDFAAEAPHPDIYVSVPPPPDLLAGHIYVVVAAGGYAVMPETHRDGRNWVHRKEGQRCENPPARPADIDSTYVYMRHRQSKFEDWYSADYLAYPEETYKFGEVA